VVQKAAAQEMPERSTQSVLCTLQAMSTQGYDQAAEWYQKAAEQGFPMLWILWVFATTGEGFPRMLPRRWSVAKRP